MTEHDREQRLEQVIADYLVAEDAGTPQDFEELVAAHHDLADDLRTFFREYHRIGRLSAPMRAAAGGPSSCEPEPTPGSSTSIEDSQDATIKYDPTCSEVLQPQSTEVPRRGPNGSIQARGTRVRYIGDYEIREELGRGGMGVVYRARQVSLNRPVALKMIKAGVLADDSELRRFQNEAEAVALLDHAGIVPVYEVGDHEGQRYFSMKLVTGGSLADRLGAYKGDPKAAARLIADVAEAVHHAHMRGILHRDIKPANILLDERGNPHVTDFGLAKRVEAGADAEMTASGAILGTPAYMAPEQASGRRGSITTATDVYGLGALLYAVLAGQAPFAGDSAIDTLTRVREQSPEPLRKQKPAVPRDLEVIALKCLAKDPRRRYSSAQAMADDLRAWLDGRPIAARPVGTTTRAWMWCKRRPALAGLLAALLVSLLGATALSIAYAKQQTERAKTEHFLREQAMHERDRNARQAYTSAINLACREWHDGNPAQMRALLDSTRPQRQNDLDFRSFEWSYLDRLDHTAIWSSGAKDTLSPSIAFSPDGTWVAAGRYKGAGQPGDIHILNARDGRELRSIAGGRYFGSRIAISPDGAWIASGGENHSVVIWDARDGAEVQRLVGHQLGPGAVIFCRDGRLLASLGTTSLPTGENEIRIWNLAEKRQIQTIKIASYTYHCAFSPDGKRLATASGSGLQLWDSATGKLDRQLETGVFTDVAFSPDGRLLAGSTFSGWIGLWNATTGVRGGTLAGHRGEIWRIGFSQDGKRLASAGRDRIVRIWDVAVGRVQRELRGHESDIWDVSFSPEGTRLASVGFLDGVAKLWDTERGQESIELSNGPQSRVSLPTFGLAISPDSRVLFAAQAAGALEAWQRDRKTSLFKLEGKVDNGRNWVAISSLSDVLATLDEKRSIVLRNPSSGELIRTLDASENSRIGAFSPDGQFLAAGGDRLATIRIWEVASGHLAAVLQGHTGPVDCLAFSPDGQRLASGSFDATVRIWDFPARKEMLVYRGHSSLIACVAFCPDGKRLASASADNRLAGEIHLWDVMTGQKPQILRRHASFVRRVSFLPDGRRLVSLGDDGMLKLWDYELGQETLSIAAHSRNGLGLAVSPDGRVIATSGAEDSLRLWDSTPVVQTPMGLN